MSEKNDSPEAPPNGQAQYPLVAVFIGFLPLALYLAAGLAYKLNCVEDHTLGIFLMVVSAVSVISYVITSSKLFCRKTTKAILSGIAFLLLNGGIAYVSGLTAAYASGVLKLKF